MSSSRNHQQTHGISQIDQQLKQQAQAAVQIQGASQLDQEVLEAANRQTSELDEVIVTQEK